MRNSLWNIDKFRNAHDFRWKTYQIGNEYFSRNCITIETDLGLSQPVVAFHGTKINNRWRIHLSEADKPTNCTGNRRFVNEHARIVIYIFWVFYCAKIIDVNKRIKSFLWNSWLRFSTAELNAHYMHGVCVTQCVSFRTNKHLSTSWLQRTSTTNNNYNAKRSST